MKLTVLGPIEIFDDEGRALSLPPARLRLLVLMALSANRYLSADELAETLWEGNPPATALTTLRSHVSRLRQALGGQGRIETVGQGYRFRMADGECDRDDFLALVAQARRAPAGEAEHIYDRALRLWRGPALADCRDASWAIPETSRLEEERVSALEERAEALIASGRNTEALAELDILCRAHPLRERLWGARMLALYRSGRQADALAAFQALRVSLVEELGIDPSPELVKLESAILKQSPDLDNEVEESAGGRVLTFMLTDIVGSTRLWDIAPTVMAQSLQRHERLIEDAVRTHGGRLLKSKGEGDSTLSVFTRASDAVAAASDAQAALNGEPWPSDTPIRVRMSLHTGESQQRGEDYFGPTVNRAARLRSLAGPGQVLVSRTVAELVADHLPSQIQLVEIGQRELRDLARPEHVFAIAGPGLSTTVKLAAPEPLTGIPLPGRLARTETTPFCGRRDERDRLDRALASVGEDRWRRLVVVIGEAGVGKTRLVSDVARDAHSGGATVLLGRCSESLSLPFGPFREALGHLVRHSSEERLQAHAGRHGSRLARLVPDLAERLPGPRDDSLTDVDAERHLLFEAATDLFFQESREAPLVVVIDDLQWIDSLSLQLLRYLLQIGEPGPVLLLATCRDAESDVRPDVAQLLRDLWREEGSERIDLAGFNEHEVRELVEALAGQTLGPDSGGLIRGLSQETGGNPFMVRQLLIHLRDTGAISRQNDRWVMADPLGLAIPPSVHDLVMTRVDRLGAEVERVLTVAAVAGNDFDLDLLVAATAGTEEELFGAVEQARNSGLVRRGLRPGQYSFVHGIVAHALVDRAGPLRARLHARLAAELAHRPGTPPAEVAFHSTAAGTRGDPGQSVLWSRRAGHAAVAALAPGEAVSWFEAAYRALDRIPDLDPATRTEIMIEWGHAQLVAGDRRHRETLFDAAALAQKHDNRDLFIRAVLTNYRGWESWTGVVDPERVALLEAALELAPDESGERARLLAHLASELTYSPDRERTLALADEALDLARRIDDPADLLHVMLARFPTTFGPDRASQCHRETAELVELAREAGDPQAEVFAALYRFHSCLAVADRPGLASALEVARAAVDRLSLPLLQHLVLVKENMLALLDGDLVAAEEHADRAFELGKLCGVGEAPAHYYAQVTRIRHAQGRLDELIPVFEKLATKFTSHLELRSTLCRLYCLAGRYEDARPWFDQEATRQFDSVTWNRYLLMTMAAYAEAASDLEVKESAGILYRRLVPFCDQVPVGDATFLAPVAFYCGRLASVLDNRAQALDHFAQADRIATQLDSRIWSVVVRAEWAATLLGGEPDEVELQAGRDLVTATLSDATQVKFWPVVTRCQRLLEEHFPGA